MEALPFLKGNLGVFLILLRVPTEHLFVVLHSHTLTISRNDTGRVIKQIICIDKANVYFAGITLGVSVDVDALGCNLRAHLTNMLQIVKDASKLVIAGLGRHEVVEPRYLIEWWNSATIVRGNAVAWMANEKGEMELTQDFAGDHRWVSRLRFRSIWIRSKLPTVDHTIRRRLGRTNSSFLSSQRRGDRRWRTIRRDKIIDHVLDEDALALL